MKACFGHELTNETGGPDNEDPALGRSNKRDSHSDDAFPLLYLLFFFPFFWLFVVFYSYSRQQRKKKKKGIELWRVELRYDLGGQGRDV